MLSYDNKNLIVPTGKKTIIISVFVLVELSDNFVSENHLHMERGLCYKKHNLNGGYFGKKSWNAILDTALLYQ